MEEYTRESIRELLEGDTKKEKGSALITLLIVFIFVFAGAFYLKTSKPELVTKAINYVKEIVSEDTTLETIADKLYDGVSTQNPSGESGEILKTADTISFEYVTKEDIEVITLSACAPLKEYTVTSPFGARTDPVTQNKNGTHHGIDLAAKTGSEILAYRGGTVTDCGNDDIYGNYVVIKHTDTLSTFYAHMSELYVKTYDTVKTGSAIGVIGSTGKSTGVHLHFEVREDGVRTDPAPYLYEKV